MSGEVFSRSLRNAVLTVPRAFPSVISDEEGVNSMAKVSYVAPMIEKIGGFRKLTNGYPFFSNRDIFGGRTFL